MTEEEWLGCDDHFLLTYFVAARISLRKLRLAEVAVCRRVEHHLVDVRSRHALEVSERYADGLASDEALVEARSLAKAAYESLLPHHNTQWNAILSAAVGVCCATVTESGMRMQSDMIDIALFSPNPLPDSIPPEMRVASLANAELIRDVFGNPFRPITLDPSWLTFTITTLARQMYESRDFSAMPILADALQDSGCEDPQILNHCRGEGVHVRGCFVIDLLTGRK